MVVANDVTYQSGSFGVKEDAFYAKVSQYARAQGLPRIYVACNSGARIGLADELKPRFRGSRGSTRRTPRPATITCT